MYTLSKIKRKMTEIIIMWWYNDAAGYSILVVMVIQRQAKIWCACFTNRRNVLNVDSSCSRLFRKYCVFFRSSSEPHQEHKPGLADKSNELKGHWSNIHLHLQSLAGDQSIWVRICPSDTRLRQDWIFVLLWAAWISSQDYLIRLMCNI